MINRTKLSLFPLAALLMAAGAGAESDQGAASDARKQLDEARQVVEQMKTDPEMAELLENAHGVFIIPDYAKAAAVVGGQGGEGVVLLRTNGGADGGWTAPAFFDFGGASIGAEVGLKAGSIAMLLMTDKAADMFRTQDNNWSLDANAGITVVDYSAASEASAGKGDVVLWSDTEGAYAGVDVGISDINRDEEETAEFYGDDVDVQQILTGRADGQTAGDHADELRAALSS